ncbi:MAG: phospholipid carrier-dependent glycosyltransferase [Proteobacteria bacterium]|nr:phospholipid carrier-dependent glycosyltransferase [Pseudomonadota bacterium]
MSSPSLPPAESARTEHTSSPSRLALLFDLTLILALSAGVTWLNVAWAIHNQAPPLSDDNSHLFNSIQMLWQVPACERPTALWLLYPGHYPPLAYQMTFIFYRWLGPHTWVAIASFFPFLAIMGLSMYGIGVGLGRRATGLICALATLCSPVVLDHARTYFLDLPSTAMLALSLCALLYSRGFSRRGWSLLFGVSMALGMLSKWTHPAFVLPLLLYTLHGALTHMYEERWPGLLVALIMAGTVMTMGLYVLESPGVFDGSDLTHGPSFRWTPWLLCAGLLIIGLGSLRRAVRTHPHLETLANLLESFWLSAMAAWPWYYYNGERVREKIVYQAHVQVDTSHGWMTYLQDTSMMVHGAPMLLVAGIAVGLSLPRLRAFTAIFAASVLIDMALTARLPADSRYFMPAVTCVVPLALVWTAHLQELVSAPLSKRLARAFGVSVLLLVAITCLWQVTASEWRHRGFRGLDGPSREQARNDRVYLGALPVLPAMPVPGSFPYDEVLDAVGALDRSPQRWVGVLESSDDASRFQPRSFLYHAAMRQMPLFVVETSDALEHGDNVHDIEQVKTFLVIHRDLDSRKRLLESAMAHGWLPRGTRERGRFTFSPDYVVEIHASAQSLKATSP